MNKELEALENIKREAGIPYFSTLYDIDMWREDFKTVENALKALEIIKKKILDMDYFNIIADRCDLTYQEYNLLKKVLNNENTNNKNK